MGRKGGIGREMVKWAEQYHEGSGRDGGGKGKDRYPPHPRPLHAVASPGMGHVPPWSLMPPFQD